MSAIYRKLFEVEPAAVRAVVMWNLAERWVPKVLNWGITNKISFQQMWDLEERVRTVFESVEVTLPALLGTSAKSAETPRW